MKTDITTHLNNPEQLEKLYRNNKSLFKKQFNEMYSEIQDLPIAQAWNARLNHKDEDISWGSKTEWIFVLVASAIAGFIAKIPEFTGIDEDFFYPRNIAFIVFPLLIAYFLRRQKVAIKKTLLIFIILLVSIVYINFLPDNDTSDTLVLACIHLPLFLWALLGFTFVGATSKNPERRLDFLRYNGNLAVMMAVILIAGGLLTVITVGLFHLIDINVEEIYFEYIAVWGAAATPIVSTYLVQSNPQLVDKVSPVIAKVFTPLVLVMLLIYLIAVIATGKDPYNDRDFLLLFNMLLIGVMALILFSVADTSKNTRIPFGMLLLLALSAVTILVNGIALSAIVFRISEWGITPNRLAVLGSNMLILTNLLMVAYRLLKSIKNRNEPQSVERNIVSLLPYYTLWTAIVAFIFPLLFGFH